MRARARLVSQLLLLAAFLLPTQAAAQLLRGRVVDAASGQPLPLVTITLLDARDSALTRAWSDDSGHFTLRVRRSGRYAVHARRLGYEPLHTSRFALDSAERPLLELTMRAATTQALDTVRVTGRRSWKDVRRGRSLFHEHQERGKGVFLTREDFALLNATELDDGLATVPGLVRSGARGGLRSTRGNGCMKRTVNRALPPITILERFPNELRGVTLGPPPPAMGRIVGVEVYREFREVPPEYRFLASDDRRLCGIVVVWTTGAW